MQPAHISDDKQKAHLARSRKMARKKTEESRLPKQFRLPVACSLSISAKPLCQMDCFRKLYLTNTQYCQVLWVLYYSTLQPTTEPFRLEGISEDQPVQTHTRDRATLEIPLKQHILYFGSWLICIDSFDLLSCQI